MFLSALAAALLAPDLVAADAIIANSLKHWGTPGLAVAVVRHGRPFLVAGYGTKRVGAADPVTAQTLFAFGSCTKALTATLVAKAADDGVLGFDDPVRRHLPGFRLADPNADALVTLRDLLCHRTGVGGHDWLWYRAPWNRAETLKRLNHLPAAGPFRASYHYSTLMVMAAGQALANRAGKPWEVLAQDQLLTPLGMTRTRLTSAAFAADPDRARGHERRSGKVVPMAAYDLAEPNPAGSTFTCAADLVPWLQFQLADGRFAGKQLVSVANLRQTHAPHTVMPLSDPAIAAVYPASHQVSYALGWVAFDYKGLGVIAHGGILDGYRTQVTLIPERNLGIALMGNLHQTKMNVALTYQLIDLLTARPPGHAGTDWTTYFQRLETAEAATVADAVRRHDAARKPGTTPTVPLARYVGEYTHAAYGDCRVTLAGGKLTWHWSSFDCELRHDEGDTFRVADGYLADQLVDFRVADGLPTALGALGVTFLRQP